jgi:hypothetical protein
MDGALPDWDAAMTSPYPDRPTRSVTEVLAGRDPSLFRVPWRACDRDVGTILDAADHAVVQIDPNCLLSDEDVMAQVRRLVDIVNAACAPPKPPPRPEPSKPFKLG